MPCCLLGQWEPTPGKPHVMRPIRKTWCGKEPLAFDWMFCDAGHAALNGRHIDTITLCRACRDKIVEALERNCE